MDNQKKNRTGLKKVLSVALMGTICLTAAVSVASLSETVTVTDGENTVTINTINPDTNAILDKSGIKLGELDDYAGKHDVTALRVFKAERLEHDVALNAKPPQNWGRFAATYRDAPKKEVETK